MKPTDTKICSFFKMKTAIVVAVLLFALTVTFIMSGCSSNTDSTDSSGEETAISEETVSSENNASTQEKITDEGQYQYIITELERMMLDMDPNWDVITNDIGEYWAMGPGQEKGYLLYSMKDLNGDGTAEMIIGGDFDNDGVTSTSVLGIYTLKDGACYMPGLSNFYGIFADGVIHTNQGNGIPDDAHQDGYYFRITDNGDVEETSPTTDEPMFFEWKKLQG